MLRTLASIIACTEITQEKISSFYKRHTTLFMLSISAWLLFLTATFVINAAAIVFLCDNYPLSLGLALGSALIFFEAMLILIIRRFIIKK